MSNHRKRILIATFPGQGHINPSLQFAKRLLNMGVDVTFSTSLSAIRRITTAHALNFAPFSDGHDNQNDNMSTANMQQFFSDFATNGSRAISQFITSASAAGRPFHHLVYTTLLPWAARVADHHNINSTLLWDQSAISLDLYYYYFNGYQDIISINDNNPSFSFDFPGLPPLAITDLPSFFLSSSSSAYDFVLPLFKHHIDVLEKSPNILINTFDELEIKPLKAIEKLKFVPVGPLIPSAFLDGNDPKDNSFGGDLFGKSKDDYIQWLDSKPKSSVVYVSFGSLSTLSTDQENEILIGLSESGRPFLWVIREGNEARNLSERDEVKKQGMIVGWCSQLEVLNHDAIGCFLTHCGWNSTLEAVAAGVPMVGFPQWTDQLTNGKMIEDVWKTGVRMKRREEDGIVEGKEIKRCVDMVMGNEEKGVEVRKNAQKWRDLAREAVNNGGPSTVNLQTFLNGV